MVKSIIAVVMVASAMAANNNNNNNIRKKEPVPPVIQLGPRPYYLVNQMTDGPLKTKLLSCQNGPFSKSRLTIGHRGGGTLQFPEHSMQSHQAGFRMGVDITECDVTFLGDGNLVCRHDQCDLHTTTNIVNTSLNAKCTKPFTPAEFDSTGKLTKAASALCCTSDLTLAEFTSLQAKMDSSLSSATTPQQYLGGVPVYRTELYNTGGTLLTHQTYLKLVQSLGGRFTPELKQRNTAGKVQIEDVFGSQGAYLQKLVDEYKAAGINAKHVWLQSFNYTDILYLIKNEPAKHVWLQSFNYTDILYLIKNEPAFGKQAVYLDPANVVSELPSLAKLQQFVADGLKVWAPPMWALVTSQNGKIVPSQSAKDARTAGIKNIVTWTLERSGRIKQEVIPSGQTSSPSYYYQTTTDALQNDGDIFTTLDVLVRQVGIFGIFSDWASTVTYYANCMGIGLNEFFPPYK